MVSSACTPLYGRSIEQVALGWLRRCFGGGRCDASPAGDQLVVGAGILGPALALAERVQAVGELAGSLAFALHGGEQPTRASFALLLQRTNEVVRRFPDRVTGIALRIPV